MNNNTKASDWMFHNSRWPIIQCTSMYVQL